MSTNEVIIRISDRQYTATLLIDGRIHRTTVVDKWPALALWVRGIRRELGDELYARLQESGPSAHPTTLALARYLGGEGCTVGLETPRRHCPGAPLRLQ